MLATSCQQGHLDVVQLLVHDYDADAKDCAIHSDEFAVITGLPLYAAARAGRGTHLLCASTTETIVLTCVRASQLSDARATRSVSAARADSI